MAVMITGKDVSLEYPARVVLNQVTFGIDAGARIGIVGNNGTGKSSLLNVIAKRLTPDSGEVLFNGSPTIGLLAQSDSFNDDDIVANLFESTTGEPLEADKKSRSILDALLTGIDIHARIGSLSGGQRRRLDLALLLVGSWDVLLLDEPTNHLDVSTIAWLAEHLKKRWQPGQGALLVVTHDRWFLDEVCSSMWELFEGSIHPFEGGYSAYIMQRVERNRLEESARRKRENQLRRELAWLSRGAQARRSKPKFHLEQAQQLIADVPPLRDKIKLEKIASARLGKQVIELDDVAVELGGKTLVENLTWYIGAGQRIGILGINGSGKTTLLRLLSGEIAPTRGRIRIGKTVVIGHLSQTLTELADVENDIVRVVCSRYKTSYEVDGKLLSPTAILERLGFSSDDLNTRCKDLSGGQRRRLQFMLTLFGEPNVLFLDEPGNDLDTDMLAAMEDLLDAWPGTLFVVSHDRYLIERVTDDQYALIGSKLVHLPGGVDEYLSLMNNAASDRAKSSSEPKQSSNAEQYAIRKKIASLERKIETQRKRLEQAQSALEEADPYDFESLSEHQAALDAEQQKLTLLEDEWLELSLALQ